MKSAEILDEDHTHTLGEKRLAANQESTAADHQGGLDDLAGPLRSGHWDPAALRFVYDEPTSSVGKVLDDDTPWDKPREGDVDSSTSSVGKVLDDTAPTTEESTQDTGEGSATQGVDPSVPFDPETTPTSAEGTAATRIDVDSINFGGSAARGVDPSVPLDRADPNRVDPQTQQPPEESPPLHGEIEEHYAKDYLNVPEPVEEPAPTPPVPDPEPMHNLHEEAQEHPPEDSDVDVF